MDKQQLDFFDLVFYLHHPDSVMASDCNVVATRHVRLQV